jgi:hypothetical protein
MSTALAVATRAPFTGHRRQNDRALGLELHDAVRPGDWVCFVGAARPSLDYYLSEGRPGRPDTTIRRLQYPAIYSGNPASDYPITGDSLRAWESEALRLRARIETETDRPGTMIYVVAPMRPGKAKHPTAEHLFYPGSILAYVLNGLHPLRPIGIARGDELRVDWVLFRVPRDSLVEGIEPVIGVP